MAIEFNCPHCGTLYKLDEKFAGKMGKCKLAACRQSILIPFRSTATVLPGGAPVKVDAEALAAAALAEEQPVKIEKEAAPAAKKVHVACSFCDHQFDVDAALAGKNTTCPECGKINRVQKAVEDKPVDWRSAAAGKPSLAKVTEPIPTGAWDVQRTGVSAASLKKAGALDDVDEDDEEPIDRRIRRAKQILYAGALLGSVVFAVIYFSRWRAERKEEKGMQHAIADVENDKDGSKKPEFRAAIYTYAGEYAVRNAQTRDQLEAALAYFNKARDQLQKLPPEDPDRDPMFIELASALVVCGGSPLEVKDERRLPWDEVHPLIRKCIDKIPSSDPEMRARALRSITRELAERDQGALALKIARNSFMGGELAEAIGEIGIELFVLGKKDLAKEALEQAPKLPVPTLTALWLALHPEYVGGPADFPILTRPDPNRSLTARDARLGWAQGLALQGKFDQALAIVNIMAANLQDTIDARVLAAAAALDLGKIDDAGKAIEGIDLNFKPGQVTNSWALARAAEIAFKANKPELAQQILDAIKNQHIRSWAQLEILRSKLATQPKQKADERWLEAIPETPDERLAPALAQAEVARHNKAAGESFNAESLPAGTIRPFGYAGIALGTQDRHLKK